MNALLSFEDAPPLSVPARFFVTAPFYGVLAGLLVAWQGEALFVSRWSPAVLALTHLMTLGFLLQVMLGALFQFLPVAAGASIARPAFWAGLVHPLLNLGVLALCGGFLLTERSLLLAGATALFLAIGGFLFAAMRALLPARHTSPTIPALKVALLGLAVTVLLGLHLLAVYAFGAAGRTDLLTSLHAAWGLLGWSAVLVVGVSYVVVPMFQLTPGYGARFSRLLAPLLFVLLLGWSLAHAMPEPSAQFAQQAVGLLLFAAPLSYALTTLRLQSRSKRPQADSTVRFWRLGMASTIVATVTAAGGLLLPGSGGSQATWVFALGGLAIFGALASVVCGMLYKILPFLCWMHLQNRVMASGGGKVPHMGTFIAESAMRRQLAAHGAALLATLVSAAFPALAVVAGALLSVSFLLLWSHLIAALRAFHRLHGAIKLPPA